MQHFRMSITAALKKKLPLTTNASNVQSRPPLPSMDTVEEPESLSNFLRNDVQHDVVTVAEDFDDIPIKNRFAGRTNTGKHCKK